MRYKKKLILLYDSDSELAQNIKVFLEDTYFVKLVDHPQQIISELKKRSYDFLISDFNSIDFQFSTILNQIRAISTPTKIILMCTFFDAEIKNERFILSKVDDYIFKPFNVNMLKYKLSKFQTSLNKIKVTQ